MLKRINKLSAEQSAQMDGWADKWIEVGLRTGAADRPRFEGAAKRCYEAAGIPWHGNVIWVSSPIVMAIAAPVSGFVLDQRRGAVDGAVDGAVRGAVGGAVDGAVDGAVGGAVRDAVRDAVNGAVRGAVNGAVGGAVRGAVGGAVNGAVRGAVGGAVDGAVDGAVGDAVRGAVDGAVGGAVRGAVDGAVDGAVRDAVRDAVGDAVRGAVNGRRSAVISAISDNWHRYLGGQFWVGGWYWGAAYASFFREVCGLLLDNNLWDKAHAYEDTIQSAGWWYPHRDFVMVCERPTVISRELTDPNRPRGWGSHRLHSETGPAVGFQDGWGVYAIHGVRVPQYVVEQPKLITPALIDAETNAEVRRIMIDRYGADRYVRDSGAAVVHSDLDQYDRPRRLLRKDISRDEPIVMVEVTNATREPDGSLKKYMLRVDPNAYRGRAGRECHAAIASTWRRKGDTSVLMFDQPEDYRPVVES